MGVVNTKEGSRRNGQDDLADLHTNTLNELQILEGHKDIVRLLVVLDNARIASASDDGTIMIWNFKTGIHIFTLQGHTRPITCLLLLDPHTLVSGSSDRTIRLWNINTGTCHCTIENAHAGSVQCLAKLGSDGKGDTLLFCSGGNEKLLHLWEHSPNTGASPTLRGSMGRQEEENLHCFLPISKNRLVTGSNSSFLYVYDLSTLKFDKLLVYHRESVRCLVAVSETSFASGSLDGSVVVWHVDTLAPLKVLDYPEHYYENHIFTSSINHITVFSERYLGAAVGRGFKVYDINTGECVAHCKDAHDANVTRILCMYERTRIVSCSADSSIKLWGIRLESSSLTSRSTFGRLRSAPTNPVCLGDMWGHSDAVYDMVALSESALCTCSADGVVILWKDGREQTEIRNQIAAISLMQHLLLEPPANEEAGPGIDVPLQINLRPEGLRVVDANTEPRHGKASKSKSSQQTVEVYDRTIESLKKDEPHRMTVSDSLIITSPQKRRHTIVYRDVLDLETEAKADLQKLGGWDFPIKTATEEQPRDKMNQGISDAEPTLTRNNDQTKTEDGCQSNLVSNVM